MPASQLNQVIQHLRGDAELTDAQLLARFVNHWDETAFAALVRRHGPMVWGVCRRVLRTHHDAEDAFQATFLVLVRKAASIASRELLANFLYGVANRTALKAKAARFRRELRERQVTQMPEPAGPEETSNEVERLLDEELSALPDKYRLPIVLCDLEGKTRKEAARQLKWPEGTVAGRLARGRTLLGRRLARRGVVLSGGSLAMILAGKTASACVPALVQASTVKAASLLAAGQAAANGGISPKVAALTEGVLKAMLMTKVKMATGICLAVGLILTFGGMFGYQTLAAQKVAPVAAENKLKDTILVLDKMWWEAASKHDVDTLDKLTADNFVGLGGVPSTKASILERHRLARVVDLKVLSERELVRLNEHAVVLTYEVKYNAVTKAGAPAGAGHQRLTSCWVQRDGGWFVAFGQFVDLPDAVPAAKAQDQTKPPLINVNPFENPPALPIFPLKEGDPTLVWPPQGPPTIVGGGPVQLPPSGPSEIMPPVMPIALPGGGPVPLGRPIEIGPLPIPQSPPSAPREKGAEDPKGIDKGPGTPKAEKENDLSWGKSVGGLQAGIGLRKTDRKAYEFGETIGLVFKIRNVSETPVKFTYTPGTEDKCFLVEDTLGNPRLGVIVPDYWFYPHRVEKTLKPGEVLDFGERAIKFVSSAPLGEEMKEIVGPTVIATTGKYKIGFAGYVVDGAHAALSISTGVVEVEIKERKTP